MSNKQTLKKNLKLKNKLKYKQYYSLKILSMNSLELENFLKEEEKENPFLEILSFNEINNNYKVKKNNNEEEKEKFLESQIYKDKNWREELKLDMNTKNFSKQKIEILFFFIDSLNDEGFLEIDRKFLKKKYNLKNSNVQEIKEEIKKIDMLGIGSENTKEFFKFQLEKKKINDKKLYNIVDFYLDEIKNYRKISSILGITKEEFKEYYKILKSLKLNPIDESKEAEYIYPDIFIKKEKNKWVVELVKDYTKILKINEIYINVLNKVEDKELEKFIEEKILKINFIIECINQRQETIKQIVETIIMKQENFFTNGEIVPLTQKEVARITGRSESTVSRAIKDKYISTPNGNFNIKAFFSAGYLNKEKKISSNLIKKYIVELIKSEEIIYSDTKIMNKIKERFGIEISRRTVTKYRTEIGIPNKNIRFLNKEINYGK